MWWYQKLNITSEVVEALKKLEKKPELIAKLIENSYQNSYKNYSNDIIFERIISILKRIRGAS